MDNQQDEWRPAILRYRPHRRNNAASFTDRMHLNTYRSSDEANQGKALLNELLGPIQTGKESWQNRAMKRQEKITFGEMRASGASRRLALRTCKVVLAKSI